MSSGDIQLKYFENDDDRAKYIMKRKISLYRNFACCCFNKKKKTTSLHLVAHSKQSTKYTAVKKQTVFPLHLSFNVLTKRWNYLKLSKMTENDPNIPTM